MFAIIYLIHEVGNLGMITLLLLDSCLHNLTHCFFSNLSLVNSGVMAGLLTGDKIISYNARAAQIFFFVAFASVEPCLLTSVVYDCHTAVRKPLHSTTTTTTHVCAHLTRGSYVCSFLNASFHVGDIFGPSLCKSNIAHHFVMFQLSWLSLGLISTLVKWFLFSS